MKDIIWFWGIGLAISATGCGSDSGAKGQQGTGPTAGSAGAMNGAGVPNYAGGPNYLGGASNGVGGTSNPTGGDNTTKTHGVGMPCESSSDCPAPLMCRQDPTDYIAHKQCTTPCASDSDCTTQFGEYSMCIGANICVTKCIVASDCPAKTQCISSGWCERTGPGSGVPYCTGTVMPCAGLSETQCFGTLGCSADLGTCDGVAESCYSQFGSASCYGVQGCYWSSSSQTCSGSSESCSFFSGEATCSFQPGCYWTPGSCSGTPEPCEQIPPSLCADQTGCVISQ